MNLGRDVFLALAAIIWADGVVTPEESDALIHAAKANGLAGNDLDAIENATRVRHDLSTVQSLKLDREERVFVFGIAAWLTRVDGKVTADEVEVLHQLGDLIGLPREERELAAAASYATLAFRRESGNVTALADELSNIAR